MKTLIFLFVSLIVLPVSALEISIPPAYKKISAMYGIPEQVFFSIGLQESGKTHNGKFIPWPWTLNIDEKGYLFETREEAEKALLIAMYKAKQKGQIGRVAVGIGQIYMPAHHNQFVSPLQALDPTINLHYAANLVSGYYLETIKEGNPDWWVSVGRYHSPYKQGPAIAYRNLVFKRCTKIYDDCAKFGESIRETL